MRQTDRRTKENQRDKKGKISLFIKDSKGCVLDKSRKVIIEGCQAVKNS